MPASKAESCTDLARFSFWKKGSLKLLLKYFAKILWSFAQIENKVK